MKNINNLFSALYKDTKITYNGPVNDCAFIFAERNIEQIRKEYPKAGRQLYKIFIELFQNILLYSYEKYQFSEKKTIGCGAINILETKNSFKITTSNPAKTEQINKINKYCNYINSIARKELRKLKVKKRQTADSLKDNAGIGLIQIILNSSNPINVDMQPVTNELGFLSLTATINK